MKRVPMTIHGFRFLKKELEKLKNKERPKVAKAIGEARALGDLKENAEYQTAKENQGLIEARIRDIEYKLARANVIDVRQLPQNGIIVFGTTVHVENIETSVRHIYQLVGEDETDIKQGKISISSPIARALVGKKIGDITTAHTPSHEKRFKIIMIKYI